MLDVILNQFIEDNKEYVNYVIAKNQVGEDLKDDAIQFIVMHLLKLFSKRYKYTDFYWVTRTVIRRKIIDFTSTQERMIKGNTCEHQVGGNDDITTEVLLNLFNTDTSYKEEQRAIDIVDYVRNLNKSIRDFKNLGQLFSNWDREFFEVLLELYDYGNLTDISEIAPCMGYKENEKQEFSLKINSLRTKIRKCITEEKLEDF